MTDNEPAPCMEQGSPASNTRSSPSKTFGPLGKTIQTAVDRHAATQKRPLKSISIESLAEAKPSDKQGKGAQDAKDQQPEELEPAIPQTAVQVIACSH